MLISEIAAQHLLGFPPAARLPVKPGLNAVVSREVDAVRLLRAVLFPDPEDAEALCAPGTPRRLALTIHGRDGNVWRVIRDFAGSRSLLRSDPHTRQPIRVTEDPAELAAHLQQSIGIPGEAIYRAVVAFSAQELPSRLAMGRRVPTREVSLAAMPTATATVNQDVPEYTADEARVRLPQLRIELEKSERFEAAQDALYKLQQRYAELQQQGEGLAGLEQQIAALDRKLSAFGSLNLDRALEARLRKYPEAASRRDAALADIKRRREELEALLGPEPKLSDLLRDQVFAGGLLAGLLTTGLAIGTGIGALWLANLAGFGVAAFGAWRWVDGAEDLEHARRRRDDLEEAAKRIQRQYDQDTQPVLLAMREFGVSTPDEVLHRLSERDMLDAKRVALVRELEVRRQDPQVVAFEEALRTVQTELREREQQVNAMGFSREVAAIRREIQACEDALSGWVGSSDPDPIPETIERAAELAGASPPAFVEAIKDRLAQYLAALTDRRFVGIRPLSPGVCHVVAATGASGPLTGLPHPDRDAIYVAVRLAVAERAAAVQKIPLVFDEPSLLVGPAHRALFVRMLKSLGSMTQVIVRAFDAPPAGAVDHVVAPPTQGT